MKKDTCSDGAYLEKFYEEPVGDSCASEPKAKRLSSCRGPWRKDELEDGVIRNYVRRVDAPLHNAQSMHAVGDAGANQIVRQETAAKDVVVSQKRLETVATSGDQQDGVIELAEVYAVEQKVSNGAFAKGFHESCPLVWKECIFVCSSRQIKHSLEGPLQLKL